MLQMRQKVLAKAAIFRLMHVNCLRVAEAETEVA